MRVVVIFFFLCNAVLGFAKEGNNALDSINGFTEELLVTPFNNGQLMASFKFVNTLVLPQQQLESRADNDSNLIDINSLFEATTVNHYAEFPRSLGMLVSKFKIMEFSLAATQGRWDFNNWGYPNWDVAPSGFSLVAWLAEKEQWSGFVNTLGSLFGSSLGFMDEAHTLDLDLGSIPPMQELNNFISLKQAQLKGFSKFHSFDLFLFPLTSNRQAIFETIYFT